jgi:chitinase
MDQYLDFWNIMTYDYAGSWSPYAGHQANLSPSKNNVASTPFNTDQAIRFYIQAGIAPSKIVLGIPPYGRSFTNTKGPGTSFSGVGGGSFEPGVYDYKALPPAGATVTEDNQAVASYSYGGTRQTMISYDTPVIVQKKGQYILSNKLGGAMYWECSGDKTDSSSLISTVSLPTLQLIETVRNQGNLDVPSSRRPECLGQNSKSTVLSSIAVRQHEEQIYNLGFS